MSSAKHHLDTLKAGGLAQWGFTVYRAAYGPTSDQSWQSLLGAIQSGIRAQVLSLADGTKLPGADDTVQAAADEADSCEELLSMFHLEVKSEPEVQDGKSINETRQIIKEAESGQDQEASLAASFTQRGIFLYVDDEVLQAVESATPAPWIKVVEIDYDAAKHKGNRRTGGQRYFGWMIASTTSLFTLWDDLGGKNMWSIAPWAEDGNMTVVWDGVLNDQTIN